MLFLQLLLLFLPSLFFILLCPLLLFLPIVSFLWSFSMERVVEGITDRTQRCIQRRLLKPGFFLLCASCIVIFECFLLILNFLLFPKQVEHFRGILVQIAFAEFEGLDEILLPLFFLRTFGLETWFVHETILFVLFSIYIRSKFLTLEKAVTFKRAFEAREKIRLHSIESLWKLFLPIFYRAYSCPKVGVEGKSLLIGIFSF